MSLVVELSEAGPDDGIRLQLPAGETTVTRSELEDDTIYEQLYVASGRNTQDGVPVYVRAERKAVNHFGEDA